MSAEEARRARIRANHMALLSVMSDAGLPSPSKPPLPPPSTKKDGKGKKKRAKRARDDDSDDSAGSADDDDWSPEQVVAPATPSRRSGAAQTTPSKRKSPLSRRSPRFASPAVDDGLSTSAPGRAGDDVGVVGCSPAGPPPTRVTPASTATLPSNSRAVAMLLQDAKRKAVASTAKDEVKGPSAAIDLSSCARVSCKQLSVNVARLQSSWLGKHIPFELAGPQGRQAKLAVTLAACAVPGVVPAFSKLSGITQWRDAIMLWVNVGGQNYNNVFSYKPEPPEAYMTWFAQRRQTEDSPVIQAMLPPAPHSSSSSSSSSSTAACDDKSALTAATAASPSAKPPVIILFCRLPDEPYVYCGRLAHCSHEWAVDRETQERSLKFLWRLVDAPALMAGSEAFRAMLYFGEKIA